MENRMRDLVNILASVDPATGIIMAVSLGFLVLLAVAVKL